METWTFGHSDKTRVHIVSELIVNLVWYNGITLGCSPRDAGSIPAVRKIYF